MHIQFSNIIQFLLLLWSPAVHPKQGPKVTIDTMVTGGLASSSYPATASNTGS